MPSTEPAAAPINLFKLTCRIRSSNKTMPIPNPRPAPAAWSESSPKGFKYHAATDRMRTKTNLRKSRSYMTPHSADTKRLPHHRTRGPLCAMSIPLGSRKGRGKESENRKVCRCAPRAPVAGSVESGATAPSPALRRTAFAATAPCARAFCRRAGCVPTAIRWARRWLHRPLRWWSRRWSRQPRWEHWPRAVAARRNADPRGASVARWRPF